MRWEEAQKQQRPKISRKDTKAFLELLESEPFADADDSYFEDEEYGTVSALLAEGAKPFLKCQMFKKKSYLSQLLPKDEG